MNERCADCRHPLSIHHSDGCPVTGCGCPVSSNVSRPGWAYVSVGVPVPGADQIVVYGYEAGPMAGVPRDGTRAVMDSEGSWTISSDHKALWAMFNAGEKLAYGCGYRDGKGAASPAEPALNVGTLADILHRTLCGALTTIDPQQCIYGRAGDERRAAAILAEIDAL